MICPSNYTVPAPTLVRCLLVNHPSASLDRILSTRILSHRGQESCAHGNEIFVEASAESCFSALCSRGAWLFEGCGVTIGTIGQPFLRTRLELYVKEQKQMMYKYRIIIILSNSLFSSFGEKKCIVFCPNCHRISETGHWFLGKDLWPLWSPKTSLISLRPLPADRVQGGKFSLLQET